MNTASTQRIVRTFSEKKRVVDLGKQVEYVRQHLPQNVDPIDV